MEQNIKPDDALILKLGDICETTESNVKNNVPLVLDNPLNLRSAGDELQDLFEMFKDNQGSPAHSDISSIETESSWSDNLMDTPSPLSDTSDQFFSDDLFVNDLFPQLLAA